MGKRASLPRDWKPKKSGLTMYGRDAAAPTGLVTVGIFAANTGFTADYIRAARLRTDGTKIPCVYDELTDTMFVKLKEGALWAREEHARTQTAAPRRPKHDEALREKLGVTFGQVETLAERAREAGWVKFADALVNAASVGREEVEEEIAGQSDPEGAE